jgi:hypothetical protein
MASIWTLREGEGEPTTSTPTRPAPETRDDETPVLACARCREPITTDAEKQEIAGAHEHTFMNPHGFCFRIGCFAGARALRPEGGWSAEWSWFPPCEWQTHYCARCEEHLGWLFRGPGRRFYGLVLDRLVRLDS